MVDAADEVLRLGDRTFDAPEVVLMTMPDAETACTTEGDLSAAAAKFNEGDVIAGVHIPA
jgi:hypothetical protein